MLNLLPLKAYFQNLTTEAAEAKQSGETAKRAKGEHDREKHIFTRFSFFPFPFVICTVNVQNLEILLNKIGLETSL